MADRTLSVNLFANIQGYVRGMDEVARKTRDTTATIEQQTAAQQAAYERVGATLALVGGAIVTSLALSAKAAIDWESAWAGVLKTVDGSPEQLAEIEDSLRGLARALPATHEEIAAVAEAAGQLGISVENIPEFTRVMIDMGESTNLSSDQAATSLARFMNVMGTAQDEVGNLGSAVVALGNNYATTEAEIVEMAQRLSGAGRQIGLTEGEVLGLATSLSSVGIEAEAGGSAISKVMIDIAASVDEGGERLGTFAEVAGVSADEFASAFRTAPGEALALFVQGLANAESQGKSTLGILADLEITEVRMRDALLRSAAASDLFTASMEQGNEAYADGNALSDEAGRRYETLASQIDITRNKIIDMAISFGETLTPAFAGAVEGVGDLADMLGAMPGPVQEVVVGAAALTGGIALLGGGALVAIPQIAAFKTALDTLNISAGSVRGSISNAVTAIGGPWTLVTIGAATLAIGALLDESRKARTEQSEWNAAINEGVDAIGMFRLANEAWGKDFELGGSTWDGSQFVDNLSNIPSYLDLIAARSENAWAALNPDNIELDNSGFASALRQIDEAVASTGDIDKMQESFRSLASGMNLTREDAENLLTAMPQLRSALIEQATAADVSVTAYDGSIDSQRLLAFALDETTAAARPTSEAIEAVGDSAEAAAQASAELYETQKNLEDLWFGMQDAMRNYEQSIDDIAEAMTGEDALVPALNASRDAFDLSEQGGRDASEMLEGLIISARDAAEAMYGNGESAEAVAAYQESAREQIQRVGEQMGLSEEAAREYAERLTELPERVSTEVSVDTAAAEAALARLARDRTARVIASVVSDGQATGFGSQAYRGAAVARAGGGIIPGPPSDRDNILAHLATGEFVVNARQTSQHRQLLEAINAGRLPAYATGGYVQSGYMQSQPVPVAAPVVTSGPNVQVSVQPAPGMSERAIGEAAASAIAWSFR